MGQPTGTPIRIGARWRDRTAGVDRHVHQLVGDIYVADLTHARRPARTRVDWIVKDDQSKPDLARTLYEQLITVDKVDLLMGPYATGAILSAMGVAQRYNKVLVHHTFGIPSLAKYDAQFPTWSLGADPGNTFPNTVLDMLAATPKPPKTIAIVTSKFPSVHFMSLGAREVAKKRGVQEVLFLEWEFGNREFGPTAARIKDAKPDFVWVGALGLEATVLEAIKKIDYTPPYHFTCTRRRGRWCRPRKGRTRSPARSSRSTSRSPTSRPAEFVKAYTSPPPRPDCRTRAWRRRRLRRTPLVQVLEAAVKATKSLDDKVLADWLRKNRVDTIQAAALRRAEQLRR